MKMFFAPRAVAAKLVMYLRGRAARRPAPEQPSFWILHAR